MKTNPDSDQPKYSIRAFCDYSGYAYGTIKRRLEQAGHSTERGARFTLPEFLDAITSGIDGAQLRKLQAEADLVQLRVAELRATLIDIDKARDDFARWVVRIRSVIQEYVADETARTRILKAIAKPLNEEIKAPAMD